MPASRERISRLARENININSNAPSGVLGIPALDDWVVSAGLCGGLYKASPAAKSLLHEIRPFLPCLGQARHDAA